jgi:hypothetical protein
LTETVKFVFVVVAVKLPVGERLSQLLVVQLCSETWAVALVLLCAVTVSVREAGSAPLATALNVKVEGVNVRGPVVAAVTSSVTLKISEPCDDPTVMVLLYVPTWRPAGLTDIVRSAGVVLLLRLADTQVLPSVDKVKATDGVLKTL